MRKYIHSDRYIELLENNVRDMNEIYKSLLTSGLRSYHVERFYLKIVEKQDRIDQLKKERNVHI